MSDWITIADAAARLRVNPKTVRRMIARGEIEARRIGPRLIRVNPLALGDLGQPLQHGGGAA